MLPRQAESYIIVLILPFSHMELIVSILQKTFNF